jgi:hypothetical protein
MRLFRWRYLLCPVVVDWRKCKTRSVIERGSEEWRTLFVFGVRVAMWRCD